MSGNPYNSVLRSGLTRRLWLIITLAMLIPVGIAMLSRWFEAEERRAQPAEPGTHGAVARQGVDAAVQLARVVPEDFAQRPRWPLSRGARWHGRRALPQQPGARRARAAVRAPRAECRRCARRHDDPRVVRGGPRMAWRNDVPAAEHSRQSELGRHHRGVRTRGDLRHRRRRGWCPRPSASLALTIVMAFAVAAIVSERYLPPLRALQRGLARSARTPLRNPAAQYRR